MSTPTDTSLPLAGSAWQHHSGRTYTVLTLSNTEGDDPERFVPTVVYQGEDGRVWSRPVSDWHRSMSLLAAPKQASAPGAPYVDSAPGLHVGDSAFESWFESYVAQGKGDKQRARDAYAAGMGDLLVAQGLGLALADPQKFTDGQVDRILRTHVPGGSTALAWFLPYANERGLANIRDVVRLMLTDALPMLAKAPADLESLRTQVALLKSAVEARGRLIAQLKQARSAPCAPVVAWEYRSETAPGERSLVYREPIDLQPGESAKALTYLDAALPSAGARHLTVTTTPQGEAVLVSWQDDEHRILEVVWERKPKEDQAAPGQTPDGPGGPGECAGAVSQYAQLDELILTSLREAGPGNFSRLLSRTKIAAETGRVAEATGREQTRVMDGRLRALASRKLIIYRGGQWRLWKQEDNHG